MKSSTHLRSQFWLVVPRPVMCRSSLGGNGVESSPAIGLTWGADLEVDHPGRLGEVLGVAPTHVYGRGRLLQPTTRHRAHRREHPVSRGRPAEVRDQ